MEDIKLIKDLRELNKNDFYITCNGKIVQRHEEIKEGNLYRIVPRLLGGKGGFGSMLRAIGAQIDKTNNREACRDLSGRRMRDVNNEKQLKEWVAKKAEKEKEREEKRKERMERRRAVPNHKFDDPLYDKQRAVVAENQEDALQIGLQRAQSKQKASCTITSEEEAGPSGSGLKRKSESKGGPCKKATKHNEWLGIDIENLSDLDSEEESDSSNSEKSSEDQSVSSSSCQEQTEATSIDPSQNIASKSQVTPDSEVNMEETQQTSSDSCKESKQESTVGQTDNGGQSSSSSSSTEEPDKESTETQEDKPFDFDDYSSATDMEVLGLEKLKSLLIERGMKCGGTLQQRAERLFSVKGLDPKDIDPSLLAKPSKGKGKK